MICGLRPLFFSCSAIASICLSVSERKNVSPTVIADVSTRFRHSSDGILTIIFLLSTAVLNRTHVMDFVRISSSTLGVVICSSFMEKGSKPAKKADVSRTITLLCGLFSQIFHPMPLNSNLFRNLS
jgi:hypothetical protein